MKSSALQPWQREALHYIHATEMSAMSQDWNTNVEATVATHKTTMQLVLLMQVKRQQTHGLSTAKG